MKVVNFGSLNLDFVYKVDHIVKPGETIASSSLNLYCGGKGLNQSVALSKAGVKVHMAGLIGQDGEILRQICEKNKIDHSLVKTINERSGNAIIRVAAGGENSIVLFGGANQKNTQDFISHVLDGFDEGDLLLLQNEVNLLPQIIDYASVKGMLIALNPSPFNQNVLNSDLTKITYLILNEIEGEQLTKEKDPDKILEKISGLYPSLKVVLTLGKAGAWYMQNKNRHFQKAIEVTAIDTTSAGDAFTGYFLAGIIMGKTPQESMLNAAKAAAITVSKPSAADSIPHKHEL